MTYPDMDAAVTQFSQTSHGQYTLFTDKAADKISICKYGHHGVRGTSTNPFSVDPLSQLVRIQKEIWEPILIRTMSAIILGF